MEQWIFLSGLEVPVSIGIHDFERRCAQPYRLNIKVAIRPGYIVLNDAIEETVDYDALRLSILSLLSSRHFNTQEYLIQEVMKISFNLDVRVHAADVEVSKTSVYSDCQAVGLHYRMSRQEWLELMPACAT